MSVSDTETEDLKKMKATLKGIADAPIGEAVTSDFSRNVISASPKGLTTAEIAELVVVLTETMKETNQKLTEVKESINALQKSFNQAQE